MNVSVPNWQSPFYVAAAVSAIDVRSRARNLSMARPLIRLSYLLRCLHYRTVIVNRTT